MRRCVIVGGAEIKNYDVIKKYLKADDFVICCDCGLRHRAGLGISADLIIGDFDSYENPNSETETVILPVIKDDTDTVYAAKEALKRGFEDFLLVGVFGGRLDHTIANISILLMLEKQGKTALAVDDCGEISVVKDKPVFIDDNCKFFSVLNITGNASGIIERNVKYPLENAVINCDYQYGVSNEVNPGQVAEVSVKSGELLLVKIRK